MSLQVVTNFLPLSILQSPPRAPGHIEWYTLGSRFDANRSFYFWRKSRRLNHSIHALTWSNVCHFISFQQQHEVVRHDECHAWITSRTLLESSYLPLLALRSDALMNRMFSFCNCFFPVDHFAVQLQRWPSLCEEFVFHEKVTGASRSKGVIRPLSMTPEIVHAVLSCLSYVSFSQMSRSQNNVSYRQLTKLTQRKCLTNWLL